MGNGWGRMPDGRVICDPTTGRVNQIARTIDPSAWQQFDAKRGEYAIEYVKTGKHYVASTELLNPSLGKALEIIADGVDLEEAEFAKQMLQQIRDVGAY